MSLEEPIFYTLEWLGIADVETENLHSPIIVMGKAQHKTISINKTLLRVMESSCNEEMRFNWIEIARQQEAIAKLPPMITLVAVE